MRRAPLIVALTAGLVLTGCGIPDNTEVEPLRPGPSTGVFAGDDREPSRSTRADTLDRAQFVRNYLEAAAGDFDGATERVKQFLSPDLTDAFKPTTGIKVLRLIEEPLIEPGNDTVRLSAQDVGTLRADGVLLPGFGQTVPYDLTVGEVEGQQGLFVTKTEPVLLLSNEALEEFYEQRTIYFWNSDHTGLVPDLRYMPLSVPREQEPNEVIDWLITGPSPLLADVVDGLRDGTKAIGNVPAISNDTLQISLSGEAVKPEDPGALDRLQKQLRWSLRSNLPAALELTVEHQFERKKYTGADYLTSNPAYRQIADAERFAVYNGQIRRLARSYNPVLPVPVVAPEANKGVRSAALSTSGTRSWAALVVNEARGRQALQVGAADPGERATLRRIALPGPVSRPAWAKSLGGEDARTTGLVSAAGKLYWFSAEGATSGEVAWPSGPRGITAVAVAPDGHRVAVLARGTLYVAALNRTEDGARLTAARAIKTQLTALTAVDWSSEGMLVVAGKRPASNRVAIMEVSVDGATQTDRLSDLGSSEVSHLAALPANPARGEESGAIAYVLGGVAYDEVNPDKIGVDDLAEQVTDPPGGVLPTNPFFLN